MEHFFLFANVGKVTEALDKPSLALSLPADVYNMSVERLELSARTLNCLKRAHIDKVGEVLEKDRSELLRIRNFGEKSLVELYGRLDELGFLPQETPSEDEASPDEEPPADNEESSADDGAKEEETEPAE